MLDFEKVVARSPRTSPRGRLYAVVTLTLVLILLWNNTRYLATGFLPSLSVPYSSSRSQLRVAIVETKGCHDEVSASFFSAFGQMPGVHVDAYLADRRFGIEAIYEQLPGHRARTMLEKAKFTQSRFKDPASAPDVVLSITSEYDFLDAETAKTITKLYETSNATLFAVLHHPHELGSGYFEAVKPWIASQRIRFITLSDHVSEWMVTRVISKWAKDVDISRVPVSTYPPVFVIPDIGANTTLAPKDDKLRFTMQGDLVLQRGPNRDYTGTFKRFGELMHEKEDLPVEMTVIGEGGLPTVPDEAKGLINFERSLPYPAFYGVMHFSTALLPALASNDYLDRKASSTIPASLIAGAPLIADQKMLKAYTYLAEDDVYYRENDESEIDVVARLASLPADARAQKSERLRQKNERMTRETRELLENWMAQSMGAVER